MSEALNHILDILRDEAMEEAYAALDADRRDAEVALVEAEQEIAKSREAARAQTQRAEEMHTTLLRVSARLEEFAAELSAGLR